MQHQGGLNPIWEIKSTVSLRLAMAHPEISLVGSSFCFGIVIGFFAGYAVRAYISFLRRRERN